MPFDFWTFSSCWSAILFSCEAVFSVCIFAFSCVSCWSVNFVSAAPSPSPVGVAIDSPSGAPETLGACIGAAAPPPSLAAASSAASAASAAVGVWSAKETFFGAAAPPPDVISAKTLSPGVAKVLGFTAFINCSSSSAAGATALPLLSPGCLILTLLPLPNSSGGLNLLKSCVVACPSLISCCVGSKLSTSGFPGSAPPINPGITLSGTPSTCFINSLCLIASSNFSVGSPPEARGFLKFFSSTALLNSSFPFGIKLSNLDSTSFIISSVLVKGFFTVKSCSFLTCSPAV